MGGGCWRGAGGYRRSGGRRNGSLFGVARMAETMVGRMADTIVARKKGISPLAERLLCNFATAP